MFTRAKLYLKMRIKVVEQIEKYNMLNSCEAIVVGVSGGADSVCLLFLLCEIITSNPKYRNISIEVVHVNHMIRDNADEDAAFVKSMCERLEQRFGNSIVYHLVKVDIPLMASTMKLSCEEAGRMARYDAFNKVAEGKNAVIAVAHNANDRAETMLFNMFRGSRLRGLRGIVPVSDNIIRPLLDCTREEIEKFAAEEGLEFVTDETNLTDDYSRNKIRHNILQYATQNINLSSVQNLCNTAKSIEKVQDFLDCHTRIAVDNCVEEKEEKKVVINLDKLKGEHEYLTDAVLYEMFAYVAQRKKDISSVHIESIKKLINCEGSKTINLPYEVMVKKEYSRLYIYKGGESDCFCEKKGKFNTRVLESFSMNDIPNDTYTKWFDYDKIATAVDARFRQEGDYLVINEEQNTKTLKEYMINEKIPKDQRDSIPILADGNHVMWVVGYRISEYYKVSENTGRVLEVNYVRED